MSAREDLSRRTFLEKALLGAGAAGLVAAGPAVAQLSTGPRFTTGSTTVAPTTAGLNVAMTLMNAGSVTARDVRVTAAALPGWRLTSGPLPNAVGDLTPGSTGLSFAFEATSPTTATPLLTVRGDALDGAGRRVGWSVNRRLTITDANAEPMLFSNRTDPLALSVLAPSGERVYYYGPKDAGGLLTMLTDVHIVASDGSRTRCSFNVDGAINRYESPDGTVLRLDWHSTTQVTFV
jgi:hypothetical protein